MTGATDAFDASAGEHYSGSAAASALAAFGVLKVGGSAEADFYWGDGAEMDDKLVRLAMAQRMLEDGELSGQVIDLRFRDRLVVR